MFQISKKMLAKILTISLVLAILPTSLVSATGDLSVELTANMPAVHDLTGEHRIYAEIGDVVEFTRHITADPGAQFAWEWIYNPAHLDCAAYPAFDSDTFRCTVLQEGYSPVFVRLYPALGGIVESNIFWVSLNPVNWDVIELSNSPQAHIDPQTGNVVLEITSTMQYRGEAPLIFDSNYIWGVQCRIFDFTAPPETPELFMDTRFFGEGATQGAQVSNGGRVTSTVAMQLDRALMQRVKNGPYTLFCALTYSRGPHDTLLLGMDSQIKPEAIFNLSRTNRWGVRPVMLR